MTAQPPSGRRKNIQPDPITQTGGASPTPAPSPLETVNEPTTGELELTPAQITGSRDTPPQETGEGPESQPHTTTRNNPRSQRQDSPMNQILQDIRDNSQDYRGISTEKRVIDYIDETTCTEVVQRYHILHQTPPKDTWAGLTLLIQQGGTNQSKRNLTVNYKGNEYDLNKLRQILTSTDKTYTVRKFAKGARAIIIEIALLNNWPGPLTKSLVQSNPNLEITSELAPWCNEIHSDNYDCPHQVRDALIRREEQLKALQKFNTNFPQKIPNNNRPKAKGRKRGKKK